jgi:CspA family cold shock protein
LWDAIFSSALWPEPIAKPSDTEQPTRRRLRRCAAGIQQQRITTMAMNGTIKRLVSEKGFGFVAAEDGSEYFFHQSACAGTRFDDLREGQAVTFEKGQGPKGPRAENVKLA